MRNRTAHKALTSHGWQHLGDAADDGQASSSADAYAHHDFGQINVAASGEWEHVNAVNLNMPARGRTARQLVRYLSVVHGTASIADLHLPGRKDDDE